MNKDELDKLDLILARLDELDKKLTSLLNLVSEDTPTREFLLNLGADIIGNLIKGGSGYIR